MRCVHVDANLLECTNQTMIVGGAEKVSALRVQLHIGIDLCCSWVKETHIWLFNNFFGILCLAEEQPMLMALYKYANEVSEWSKIFHGKFMS